MNTTEETRVDNDEQRIAILNYAEFEVGAVQQRPSHQRRHDRDHRRIEDRTGTNDPPTLARRTRCIREVPLRRIGDKIARAADPVHDLVTSIDT